MDSTTGLPVTALGGARLVQLHALCSKGSGDQEMLPSLMMTHPEDGWRERA